ncbi:MAG: hypothetical protein NVS3B26_04850 [Mycobacteriales bacterium]
MMLPGEARELVACATAYARCSLPDVAADLATALRHRDERLSAQLALYRYLTDLGWTAGH